MDNNMPVYDFDDAVNFIAEWCDISKDIIEKVLISEEDYMRSIGIISEEDPDIEWNFQVDRGDLMQCPYCGEELRCIDYYGHTKYSEHYWIYPHSWIEKEGDIYQCQNEECDSQVFNGHFYDRCDGDLREGYPC